MNESDEPFGLAGKCHVELEELLGKRAGAAMWLIHKNPLAAAIATD